MRESRTHHLYGECLPSMCCRSACAKSCAFLPPWSTSLSNGMTYALGYSVAWSSWYTDVTPASCTSGEAHSESSSSAGETWKLQRGSERGQVGLGDGDGEKGGRATHPLTLMSSLRRSVM